MDASSAALMLSVCFILVAESWSAAIPIAMEPKISNSILKERARQNAMDYMRSLHGNLTDEDGTPLDLKTIPTSVLCLLDQSTFTTRPEAPKGAWESSFDFVLPINAPEQSGSEVARAVLRLYLLSEAAGAAAEGARAAAGTAARLTISVVASVALNDKESLEIAEETLHLADSHAGWIELDITQGIKKVWHSGRARLTVRLAAAEGPAATFSLVDGVSLAERTAYAQFQPLLVVHFSDEALRQKLIRNEREAKVQVAEKRSKRGQPRQMACKMYNYTIQFSDVNLNSIIVPVRYNARKCVGYCSPPYDSYVSDISNYATLINSAKAAYASITPTPNLADEFVPPPVAPCCVPTGYNPITVLSQNIDGSTKMTTLSDMVVTACGCR